MQSQNYYNVTVIKPINDKEIKERYTEAVFKIIKKRVSKGPTIAKIIGKLECDGGDKFEGSRNI